MTNLEIHEPTGLPIYQPPVPIATLGRNLSESFKLTEGPAVVRQVRLVTDLGALGLKETLDIADEVLNTYAAACRARVPRHTWGLYAGTLKNSEPHELIPTGYSLVAEVEKITDVTPLDYADSVEVDDLLRHHTYTNFGPRWADARTDQFANGRTNMEPHNGRWLLDIEPYVTLFQNLE